MLKDAELERQRLNELLRLNLSSTTDLEALSHLTKLAATICGVSYSAISIVRSDDVLYRDTYNFSEQSLPREQSICHYALECEGVYVVADARKDERFNECPYVTDAPHLRFYAGAPLISSNGFRLGTLCVLGEESRELSDAQAFALQTLANQVVTQFEWLAAKKNEEVLRAQTTQLMVHSKLITLGEIVSGITHEINNPLAVIQSRLQYLKLLSQRGVLTDVSLQETVAVIETMGTRIGKVIRGLRVFAKTGEQEPFSHTSLNQIVEDTLDLCRERYRLAQVELRVTKNTEALYLDCQAVKISQVLLSLLNNAFNSAKNLSQKWVEVGVTDFGSYVQFEVIDSSMGIPANMQQPMSDLLAANDAGKSSGLGLSVSKGIVESHEGVISYDSSETHNKFIVTLPKRHVVESSGVAA